MLNKSIIQGRLTKEVELKTTANDISVCSFTLANDTGYGDNKKTNFINCVAWRGTAELLSKYVKKGQMIIISGSLQVRTWEKDGKKHYATEVVADEINFCGDKKTDKQEGLESEGFAPFEPGDDLPF